MGMTYFCSFYVPLCFVVSPKRCKMAITVPFRYQKGVLGRGEDAKQVATEILIRISYTSSPSIGHCWKYVLLFILDKNFF